VIGVVAAAAAEAAMNRVMNGAMDVVSKVRN